MALSRIGRKSVVTLGFICILAVIWFVSSALFPWRQVEVEATEILMNTTVSIKIFVKNKKEGERLLREAFVEAKRIEVIMEPLNGDGELKRLNDRQHGGWFVVSPELSAILHEAKKYYRLSDGAFDPTIGPVKWLWGFSDGGKVPSESDLKNALQYVGMSRIQIHGDSLFFPDRETKLDLGGIAKGYAVDDMREYLIAHGVRSILVNAGGNLSMYGKKPGGKDWVIGLRHPRLNKTIVLNWYPYSAVATSGDYERYFMENGVRYHHILDPSTGYPSRGAISVTIFTDSAMKADVLSTTLFVLGPEKALEFAEHLEHVETCIFYERDGVVEHIESSGIKGRIGL